MTKPMSWIASLSPFVTALAVVERVERRVAVSGGEGARVRQVLAERDELGGL